MEPNILAICMVLESLPKAVAFTKERKTTNPATGDGRGKGQRAQRSRPARFDKVRPANPAADLLLWKVLEEHCFFKLISLFI